MSGAAAPYLPSDERGKEKPGVTSKVNDCAQKAGGRRFGRCTPAGAKPGRQRSCRQALRACSAGGAPAPQAHTGFAHRAPCRPRAAKPRGGSFAAAPPNAQARSALAHSVRQRGFAPAPTRLIPQPLHQHRRVRRGGVRRKVSGGSPGVDHADGVARLRSYHHRPRGRATVVRERSSRDKLAVSLDGKAPGGVRRDIGLNKVGPRLVQGDGAPAVREAHPVRRGGAVKGDGAPRRNCLRRGVVDLRKRADRRGPRSPGRPGDPCGTGCPGRPGSPSGSGCAGGPNRTSSTRRTSNTVSTRSSRSTVSTRRACSTSWPDRTSCTSGPGCSGRTDRPNRTSCSRRTNRPSCASRTRRTSSAVSTRRSLRPGSPSRTCRPRRPSHAHGSGGSCGAGGAGRACRSCRSRSSRCPGGTRSARGTRSSGRARCACCTRGSRCTRSAGDAGGSRFAGGSSCADGAGWTGDPGGADDVTASAGRAAAEVIYVGAVRQSAAAPAIVYFHKFSSR